jgi:protoporphyrinogen oxidase
VSDAARDPIVVAGAGPAGLTAALVLARAGHPVVLVEASDGVGGLARTVERNGYRFDIGGHRFFTREPEIRALWDEFLGDDMLVRPRRSRILFHGHAFDYPLTAWSVARGLGVVESARIVASYLAARRRPIRPAVSIADWFTNQFGRRLFEIFFRSYTEKLWGMPCEAIGAQWAAQRVQGLSLRGAVLDMLRRGASGQRTLVTEFTYPRLGPGMLWERMAAAIEALGQRVLLRTRLAEVRHEGGAVREVVLEGPDGPATVPASQLVSTIPLRDLVAALRPAPAAPVVEAARALRYRDFLQVALILEGPDPFPDTWLYLHDASVKAGRLQNFRAWSPELVPATDRACLGLEYFCSVGDALWRLPDAELVEIATRDLASLGLGPVRRVLEGHVVRMRDAYPIYDAGYEARTATLRAGLAALSNLQVAGRNGMHRYNNMDHSMLTGMLAARNALGEEHDLWRVNTEEGSLEPSAVTRSTTRAARS